MTKKLKNEWIKALKSKKYKQGIGKLWDRKNNTFCCLGVLGKICGLKGLSGDLELGYLSKANKNLRGLSKIPRELQENCGIPQILANMNDKGYSFDQIAQYIEINL